MSITPESYIERLNELSEKKKSILNEILSLTQSQARVIAEEELNDLNELIQEKQLKIDEINKLDEEFETYCSRLKTTQGISKLEQLNAANLAGGTYDGSKRLKAITAEIMDVIKAIGEIEKENSEKSNKLLSKYGNEIKKINQGKKASNAYKAGPVISPSYFLDKKK